MFSMKVVDTDAFCEMPASAQNLYYHIGMRADDEGFFAGVKGLMAKIHASQDDLSVLLAKRYILDRGDGVYVVKHWKMNNYLQNDRIKPTEYEEKRIGLYTKRDGSYTLDPEKSATKPALPTQPKKPCIQNVSIEEYRVEESNLEKSSVDNPSVYPNETNERKTKKYAYTREQIKAYRGIAEECLKKRDARMAGNSVGEAWDNTLDDFADAIQEFEDGEPF
jgi:hypothetical protein